MEKIRFADIGLHFNRFAIYIGHHNIRTVPVVVIVMVWPIQKKRCEFRLYKVDDTIKSFYIFLKPR